MEVWSLLPETLVVTYSGYRIVRFSLPEPLSMLRSTVVVVHDDYDLPPLNGLQ
jgi:hypothetical protein